MDTSETGGVKTTLLGNYDIADGELNITVGKCTPTPAVGNWFAFDKFIVTPVAVYTINSSGADGVTITATKDSLNNSDGTTSFTREYDVNSQITLTAPATASGMVFEKWLLDGADYSTDMAITLTVDTVAHTLTAVYKIPDSPTILNIDPTSGAAAGGTSVTITGTNLTLASAVKFGANDAASFTVDSDTQITATTPAGTGVVDVSVTTTGGTATLPAAFTYINPNITVSGIVNLNDIVGQNPNFNYKATFKIYKDSNTDCNTPDAVVTAALDAVGNYSFTIAPQGEGCSVVVKAGSQTAMDPTVRYHFLAKKLTGVDLSDNATLTTVNLVNGDINDDNLIDAFDFTVLMQAYDIAEDPSSGESDLNNDGYVDAFDFTILMLSYDSAGDNCN